MGKIIRKKKLQIFVGDVAIGGSAPISVQSMTNTNTEDVDATVNQINACAKAGADIMRVSVPSIEAAYSFGKIKSLVNIPLIADIHFDYKIALEVANQGADCLRINPGNIGNSDRIAAVVQCAKDHNIPIRIGINAGSLEKDLQLKYKEPTADALVESAFRQIELLNKFDFNNFKISLKASDVLMATEAYQTISTQIDNPLHLGITEAGTMRSGTVKSAIGIGSLLMQGIGDTLRVSLAEDPVMEVKVAWDILKSLHLRSRGVRLIACPSCSRQNFDVIKTANALDAALEDVEESIDVAVIGCIVNGPGEAKIADVGLTGGSPNHLIYVDGKVAEKTASVDLVGQLETIIRNKIANKAKLIASSSN